MYITIDLTGDVGILCQLYSLFDSKIHDCASSPVELFTSGVLGYGLALPRRYLCQSFEVFLRKTRNYYRKATVRGGLHSKLYCSTNSTLTGLASPFKTGLTGKLNVHSLSGTV